MNNVMSVQTGFPNITDAQATTQVGLVQTQLTALRAKIVTATATHQSNLTAVTTAQTALTTAQNAVINTALTPLLEREHELVALIAALKAGRNI